MALPRPQRDWDILGDGDGKKSPGARAGSWSLQGSHTAWRCIAGLTPLPLLSELGWGRAHTGERAYKIIQGKARKCSGQLAQVFSNKKYVTNANS